MYTPLKRLVCFQEMVIVATINMTKAIKENSKDRTSNKKKNGVTTYEMEMLQGENYQRKGKGDVGKEYLRV